MRKTTMSTDLRSAVLQYALKKKKTKVGRGTCWDLADEALTKGAKAKSANDYGLVTSTSDDKWGQLLPVQAAQRGDILQFKDHVAKLKKSKKTKIIFPDGSWLQYEETEEREYTRGHHTAIVLSSLSGGVIAVLEQHVKRGRGVVEETVDEGQIYVSNSNSGVRRTRENVQITTAWGQRVKSYFPQPAHKTQVDRAVKSYNGKLIAADVETVETISVTGTIKAYKPEPSK
jgi:hypothetical protein